jgi:hypothetical protein
MTKRGKGRKHKKPISRRSEPEHLVWLTPEEFAFAMKVGIAAGDGTMPSETPTKMKFGIESSNGDRQLYHFGDTTTNRALFAIRDQFDDPKKKHSAVVRFFRFGTAVEQPSIAAWVRQTDNGYEVHQAVMDEIAAEPLTFGPEVFESFEGLAERVEARIATGNYDDDKPMIIE